MFTQSFFCVCVVLMGHLQNVRQHDNPVRRGSIAKIVVVPAGG